MGSLFTKLWREIISARGQWIAVIIIVMVGIIAFNSTYVSFQNLKISQESYYNQAHFADLWSQVTRIPQAVLPEMETVQGVAGVEGRVTLEVSLEVPGKEAERVYGRIHSYDPENPYLNRLHLERGRLSTDPYTEVLLEKQFAQIHGIIPGDKIRPIVNGKKYSFTVVGIVASPEYIYPMRSGKDIFPNIENFGIIYASYSLAKDLWKYDEGYNELLFALDESANTQQVVKELEKELERFGLLSIVEQKDQLSNRILEAELEQLEKMAVVLPILFLGVSSVIIYILLNRIIENQRSQIGLLKALGFSRKQVIGHYLFYGLIICLCGGIGGGILGQWSGVSLTQLYTQYFNIPVLKGQVNWLVFWLGIFLAVVFSTLGGWRAAKKITRLTPAQALRPATPAYQGRETFLEKIPWFWNSLDLTWRYALRNLLRNKQRTLFTVLGVAVSAGLMITVSFSLDAMDFLLNKHFKDAQRYQLRLILDNPLEAAPILREIENKEGVEYAEPYLEVPVQIENGWRKEGLLVVGVVKDSRLYQLKDENDKLIPHIPSQGLILSHIWREKLGLKKGDWVKIKPYLGRDDEKKIQVRGFTKQYLEFNGFMDFSDLNKLIGEEKITNNILIKNKPDRTGAIRRELLGLPHTAFLESSSFLKDKFQEYLGLTYLFLGISISFGGAIAVSIIYVTNSINLLERRTELALLRTLGYSNIQLAGMIFKENAVLNMIGLAAGLPLGRIMAGLISEGYNQEIMVIPVVIYPRTYFLVTAALIAFMFILFWPNFQYIKKLNLVEVLKNREG
ncbi:MAG: ABC transporter permease [Peptococcaceae bacterium]